MHSRNTLLAGTSLISGKAKALVFATGSNSAFGKIAKLTQATSDTVSPLQFEIARVSRIVDGLSLVLGVIFFFVGLAIGLPFWANFIFVIGIIVANVPEGLLPTVTLALAIGSQRIAKRHALIRHLPAVEALGCVTVICTDKTGTLTQNSMSAKRLLARAYLFLGLMQATAAMSAYWFVLRSGGWHFGEALAPHDLLYLQATIACLSAIVAMQIANVFLCRSERQSLFARGIFSNKLILVGITTEILLIALIDYTPWGHALFGTAPIPLAVWLFILPFALGMLALVSTCKSSRHK